MAEVERKFDWLSTRSFRRNLEVLNLSEFEQVIVIATIEHFCTSLNKSVYFSARVDDLMYFEVPVSLFSRKLLISLEVEGIDALAYKIEEFS